MRLALADPVMQQVAVFFPIQYWPVKLKSVPTVEKPCCFPVFLKTVIPQTLRKEYNQQLQKGLSWGIYYQEESTRDCGLTFNDV